MPNALHMACTESPLNTLLTQYLNDVHKRQT